MVNGSGSEFRPKAEELPEPPYPSCEASTDEVAAAFASHEVSRRRFLELLGAAASATAALLQVSAEAMVIACTSTQNSWEL